jgi:dienelactone hydrolase
VEALAELEMVDASKIWLAGWALGGKVALVTAALDQRVAGVAAIAAFTPLRSAGAHPEIEGVKMYSHLHGLLPRLGFFLGRESRLPVDYDDILGAIAPRPVLVVAPQLDRYAPVAEVRRTVDAARARYKAAGRENALALETPLDFNRLPAATQELVFDWLAAQ